MIADFYPLLFVGGMWLFMMLLMAALLGFWIWMIVDCAERRFRKSEDRLVWLLIIVLVGWIGAIIYYFVIKAKDRK